VGLETQPHPPPLLLQGEEVPFELEFIGILRTYNLKWYSQLIGKKFYKLSHSDGAHRFLLKL
jgi:hypothetical protein